MAVQTKFQVEVSYNGVTQALQRMYFLTLLLLCGSRDNHVRHHEAHSEHR